MSSSDGAEVPRQGAHDALIHTHHGSVSVFTLLLALFWSAEANVSAGWAGLEQIRQTGVTANVPTQTHEPLQSSALQLGCHHLVYDIVGIYGFITHHPTVHCRSIRASLAVIAPCQMHALSQTKRMHCDRVPLLLPVCRPGPTNPCSSVSWTANCLVYAKCPMTLVTSGHYD